MERGRVVGVVVVFGGVVVVGSVVGGMVVVVAAIVVEVVVVVAGAVVVVGDAIVVDGCTGVSTAAVPTEKVATKSDVVIEVFSDAEFANVTVARIVCEPKDRL